MFIDPITWLIVGAFAIAAAAYFWDDIKAWASEALGYILDSINTFLEVASPGIVYLVKIGARVYKWLEVYVRNVYSRVTRRERQVTEISPYEVPDDVKCDLNKKGKLKLMVSAQGSF